MARRGGPAKSARSKGASSRPTPVPSAVNSALNSTLNTPLSSAYPSAYPSEDEGDNKHYVRISATSCAFEKLTLGKAAEMPKALGKATEKPFPFLDLPAELRLKVYGYYFGVGDGCGPAEAIDLDPDNYKRIHKKLVSLLCTSRAVYLEASHFFFSSNTIRLFPTHCIGRISRTKKPLLARLLKHQRACVSALELRVGPNWNKPPRGWVVNRALGLADCVNVRRVKVFVTFDPGQPAFEGWRKSDHFYEDFCRGLLDGVLQGVPSVEEVEFDAFSSIKMSGALVQGLLGSALAHGKRVAFGPERGWKTIHDDADDVVVVVAGEEQLAGVSTTMDLMNPNPGVLVAAS